MTSQYLPKLAVAPDTRAGTPRTQKQDIASASVAFTSSAERSKAGVRRLRYVVCGCAV